MSTPSLANRIARLTAAVEGCSDPIVGLVVVVGDLECALALRDKQLAELQEKIVELWWPQGRRTDGQPGQAGTIRVPVTPVPVDVGVEHWSDRCSLVRAGSA